MLRLGLEKTFKGRGLDNRKKEKVFEHMLSQIFVDPDQRRQILEFLLRKIQRDDPLPIKEASKQDEIEHERHHLQVISRAALLLRIATGSVRLLFKRGNIDVNCLATWTKRFGENRALWNCGSNIENVLDLWTDVKELLDSIVEWISNVSSQDLKAWRLHNSQMPAILTLGGCELISLWGLVG